jgi:hypothetical protein
MGTPANLYNSDADQQIGNGLSQSDLNQPQQQQQPIAQPGPVKTGLRGLLTQIMHNVAAGGIPGAAYPGDLLGEAHDRQQVAMAHAKAQAALIQAQADVMKNTVPFTLQDGTVLHLPAKMATDLYKQSIANQGKTGAAQIGANAKVQSGINTLRGVLSKQGLDIEQDENGGITGVKPLPELSAVQQAQIDLQNAHKDVLMNPNNPTFQQKEREIEARLAMARSSLALRQQGNARADAQFQINNGVTPTGAPANIVGAGQAVDANGNAIGKNFQGINTPTGVSRTAAEQGQIIVSAGNDLKADIDANRDKLGNISAIVNSAFMGTPLSDPTSARIAAKLASYAALNPRLHGFRGSQALAEFKSLVGGIPNNPDAMKAAIDGIASTAGAVQNVGTPRTNVNSKPLDAGTAATFLRQAGGDKKKARALARAAGYSF